MEKCPGAGKGPEAFFAAALFQLGATVLPTTLNALYDKTIKYLQEQERKRSSSLSGVGYGYAFDIPMDDKAQPAWQVNCIVVIRKSSVAGAAAFPSGKFADLEKALQSIAKPGSSVGTANAPALHPLESLRADAALNELNAQKIGFYAEFPVAYQAPIPPNAKMAGQQTVAAEMMIYPATVYYLRSAAARDQKAKRALQISITLQRVSGGSKPNETALAQGSFSLGSHAPSAEKLGIEDFWDGSAIFWTPLTPADGDASNKATLTGNIPLKWTVELKELASDRDLVTANLNELAKKKDDVLAPFQDALTKALCNATSSKAAACKDK
jgi:hypothetical protein